jgi:hypothetical protein
VKRQWKALHRDKENAWTRKWAVKNPRYHSDYVKTNPLVIKSIHSRYHNKKKTEAGYCLHNRISKGVGRSLKGNKQGRNWELLLGYTCVQLKRHIENLFLPGMSWENMGKWHIDHKIPVSAFNFSAASDIDFKKCWDIKNLQPLWSIDNLKKNDKLSKPHQPSLALG